jgi:hypothetical protein
MARLCAFSARGQTSLVTGTAVTITWPGAFSSNSFTSADNGATDRTPLSSRATECRPPGDVPGGEIGQRRAVPIPPSPPSGLEPATARMSSTSGPASKARTTSGAHVRHPARSSRTSSREAHHLTRRRRRTPPPALGGGRTPSSPHPITPVVRPQMTSRKANCHAWSLGLWVAVMRAQTAAPPYDV